MEVAEKHNTLPEKSHRSAATITAALLSHEIIILLYNTREELWKSYGGGQSEEEACPTLHFWPTCLTRAVEDAL